MAPNSISRFGTTQKPRLLAFTLAGCDNEEADLHIAMNMSDQEASIELPAIPGKKWCLAVDTSAPSFEDIFAPENQKPVNNNYYRITAKTVIVFENA